MTLTGDKEVGGLASISLVALPKGSGSDPSLSVNLASLPSQPDGLYTWTGHIAAGQYRFAINSAGAISSTPTFLTITAATGASANLSPDRDASANWKKAGMLSVGGIPARTTVCATLAPRGSGLDDTASINQAIGMCPVGEVVSLKAGTFTIAEGNTVVIDRGITLRGAGQGATILTRTGGATLGSYQPGTHPSWIVFLGSDYNDTQPCELHC